MRARFWILPVLVTLISICVSMSEPSAQTGNTSTPASSSEDANTSQAADIGAAPSTQPSASAGVYNPNTGGNVGDGGDASPVDVNNYQCSTSDQARCECERTAIVSHATVEQARAACAQIGG